MFTLKEEEGGIYFLNETSACVRNVKIQTTLDERDNFEILTVFSLPHS